MTDNNENIPPQQTHEKRETPDWNVVTRFWPLFPAAPDAQQSRDELRLRYWRQLAPVYLAALNEAQAGAPAITAAVESWPESEAEHQAALAALFSTSKLAAPWHIRPASLEDWPKWEAAYYDASRPLAEIPLYSNVQRDSCQQLVCLPLQQWRGLHSPETAYTPATVDTDVVASLAARIANAFNMPPQEKALALALDCSGHSIVWRTNPCTLTEPMNKHGMRVSAGRFCGFYGCLRVVLNGGEEWRIAVLAPHHFIDSLIRLAEEMDSAVS